MSASNLVRAAQGQVINLLNQIEKISEHVSALQSENDRLATQNAAQFTQITDLLGVLAEITEAAAESGPDSQNLREQISRYITGMEIRAKVASGATVQSISDF